MKQISLDQDLIDFLTSRAATPGEALGAVLRRELRVPQPQVAVTVDDDTFLAIASRSRVIGETASDILRRELLSQTPQPPAPGPQPPSPPSPEPPPAPPSDAPAIVTFHIRQSAGSLGWNDSATIVEARVGDTLRLVNDDTVAHRLHTQGRPFPHQAADMQPGSTTDLLLQTPYEPDRDGPLTDHDFGFVSRFFIRVTERA